MASMGIPVSVRSSCHSGSDVTDLQIYNLEDWTDRVSVTTPVYGQGGTASFGSCGEAGVVRFSHTA